MEDSPLSGGWVEREVSNHSEMAEGQRARQSSSSDNCEIVVLCSIIKAETQRWHSRRGECVILSLSCRTSHSSAGYTERGGGHLLNWGNKDCEATRMKVVFLALREWTTAIITPFGPPMMQCTRCIGPASSLSELAGADVDYESQETEREQRRELMTSYHRAIDGELRE
ncbi:hypothetical protein NQZ68_015991, partial [Dissostichus eleginoides]